MITAHAKINLTLSVTGRDEDSYHQLVSAVCFTDFGDKLWISPTSDKPITTIKGPFAEILAKAGGDHLVSGAHNLAKEIDPSLDEYDVAIEKHIPLGGGLGGGSADAAAYLRAITTDWTQDARMQLRDKLVSLGADVPACYINKMHIMTARGEMAHEVASDPARNPIMVIANPNCHADTGAVFRHFAEHNKDYSADNQADLSQYLQQGAWGDVLAIGNDLTSSAMALYPDISDLLRRMEQSGHETKDAFIGAGMSGSGASCFALLTDDEAASYLVSSLRNQKIWVQKTSFF